MCAVCSLMVELASYETALPSSRVWVEGDFCVAKYSQDDRWYRGKIEKRAEDNMFEVQHSLICADLWCSLVCVWQEPWVAEWFRL